MPRFHAAKIAFALIITLGACSVQKAPGNDAVTLSYDEQAARNGAAEVAAGAKVIANDIRTDAKQEGAKIRDVADRVQQHDGDDHAAPAANMVPPPAN